MMNEHEIKYQFDIEEGVAFAAIDGYPMTAMSAESMELLWGLLGSLLMDVERAVPAANRDKAN